MSTLLSENKNNSESSLQTFYQDRSELESENEVRKRSPKGSEENKTTELEVEDSSDNVDKESNPYLIARAEKNARNCDFQELG